MSDGDGRNALTERDLSVFWHPCSQMRDYEAFPPLHVVAARGAWLQLADGSQLLDAISSWWCKALGHGHPHLSRALAAQLETFEHVITANTTNAPLVRFCERLLSAANGLPVDRWGGAAPPGRQDGFFGKVFLADNGSTAVEIALKMAVQAQAQRGQPQRTQLAAFQNAYHGETLATLSVGDCALYAEPYRALLFPVSRIGGLPYRTGPSAPNWKDAAREWPAIEAQLEAGKGRLAAVVYEPILQAAGGMKLFSPELLVRLRAWATANDVYLVADEIAAGMGRCGAMLASHLAPGGPLAAMPDFAVLSKGLTAGFLPLSAVLTTDAVYQLFDAEYGAGRAFLHSNTYTGNALAVAVGNAALDVFAEEKVLDRVKTNGPRLFEGLSQLAASRPYLRNVRGCGMMAAVDLAQPDGAPLDARARTGYQVYREAVRRGALLRPLGDTMYLFPPLNSEPNEIEQMISILADSADALLATV